MSSAPEAESLAIGGDRAALERNACDVCSGRADVTDAKVTCSTHFLESLDDPYQGQGVPRSRGAAVAAHAIAASEARRRKTHRH